MSEVAPDGHAGEERELPQELAVVGALRALSVFSANQSGAYREHFADLAAVLGPDVETALTRFARTWARGQEAGVVVLTGNAGTGKTAVAEAYALAAGGALPDSDELSEVAAGRWVVKDLSGLPGPAARLGALRVALERAQSGAQVLVCANEGVVRDALDGLASTDMETALEEALRAGAARSGAVSVVNANRQRPTSAKLWGQLLDYVSDQRLWGGCNGCPVAGAGCPMRANAEALRDVGVREQLRTLVRLGTGEAVPTLREVLAILAWAIVGEDSCEGVKAGARDSDKDAFDARSGYFTRVLGGGLGPEALERSPLLSGMRRSGLGQVSDLQADGWLRDVAGAPQRVRELAGDPVLSEGAQPVRSEGGRSFGLAGTRSPLDRVATAQRAMTFAALGEMVSTDEDPTRVEDGLRAMVAGEGADASAQALWRQRLYFEAAAEFGGATSAARRLLDFRYLPDLAALATKAATGQDTVLEVNDLVRGLNFLVTGFASPTEGLVVPDPACLFSRDPGSFRPARPSLVHSQVPVAQLRLSVPDRGMVEDVLDVDHVDVVLATGGARLRIGPRMYEAIREAADYQGPVGQGVAEMNDLRNFYGLLAEQAPGQVDALRVADPDSSPPALVTVRLPHFDTLRRA